MPRPLKTFQAHLGFYDTVVAAPSRAAALKAWGSRQNLFRDGSASETKEPNAVAAATAKPGIVLRRPVGSNAPFSENPGPPQIPKAPKKPAPAPPAEVALESAPPPRAPPRLRLVPPPKPERPQPAPKPAPKPRLIDRGPLERAEKALAALKRDEQRRIEAIEKRKTALEEEERRLRADLRLKRTKAEKALTEARNAYSQALRRR